MLSKVKLFFLRWYMRMLAEKHELKKLPTRVEVIALWQFGGLGDMLLATPVIQALSKQYPQADIHVWCSHPNFAEFLNRFPQVKAVHAFAVYDFDARTLMAGSMRKQLVQISESMKSYNIDLLVNLHVPNQLDWWAVEWRLLKQLRLQYTLGFTPEFLDERSVFDISLNAKLRRSRHYTRLYNQLLEKAGIPCAIQTIFPLENDEQIAAKHMLETIDIVDNQPWICLHIGGRRLKSENKMWAVESFASLASKLLQSGVLPVLIGVDSEKGMGARLCSLVPDVRSLIGQTNMGQMAALVAMADGFVGHDSGPFHIAVACNTPAVVICGRPDAEPEYLKYDRLDIVVLTANAPDDIIVEDVYQHIKQLLAQKKSDEIELNE